MLKFINHVELGGLGSHLKAFDILVWVMGPESKGAMTLIC